LGEPSETEGYSYTDTDEDLTESWHYDDLELSLSFDEELDWKLSTIAVSAADYQLMSKKVIGLTEKNLLNFLKEAGFNNLETEDDIDESPDSKLIISDEKAITFWIEEGTVTEIQWGPFIVDDEAVIWPE
jgi:hypothetical protein